METTMIRHTGVALLFLVGLAAGGCGESGRPEQGPAETGPYRSEVDEGIGAAVMILVDTSGSMKEPVSGDPRPKHVIARNAIAKMLEATDAFVRDHPDVRVRVGVMHFSGSVTKDLDIDDYDRDRVSAALARIPAPKGETAIGKALRRARPELYRSGCFRKYVLVLTDGENTTGPEPETVAREIHRRSEGGVGIYFVAFDTDPAKFSFLRAVGGDVVPAGNSAQLEAALREIYEGRILAEAVTGAEAPIEKTPITPPR